MKGDRDDVAIGAVGSECRQPTEGLAADGAGFCGGSEPTRIFHALLSGEATECMKIFPAPAAALASGLLAKPPGGFAFSPHELQARAGALQSWRRDMGKRQFGDEKCGASGRT